MVTLAFHPLVTFYNYDFLKIKRSKPIFLPVGNRAKTNRAAASIKVLLTVEPSTAAKRVMQQERVAEDKPMSEQHVLDMIKEREISEVARYKKYYNIHPYDESHYDFVLDTTDLTVEQAADRIVEFAKSL